eukprot:TRINITY_DN31038_c0_g1_i1.p1 TRINITY_DN31038_c0_g1~~TRINITY_DN31038_c0_g1_i1.p1  ORF type:complete len:550 (+),score=73.50 TRINITY_DN31038_c0_g1_i1:91-1650(+)
MAPRGDAAVRAYAVTEIDIWRQRHFVAASNFCELMLRIRSEGAQQFQDGMWGLWQAAEALHPYNVGDQDVDPSTEALHSGYHFVADDILVMTKRKCPMSVAQSPYGAVSQRWLLSFEAMARQIRDEHARILADGGSQARALKTIVAALGKPLDGPGPRAILSRGCVSSFRRAAVMQPLGLSKSTVAEFTEYRDVAGAWGVLPLVWLPLALYVRSTTHLYEMLARLHAVVPFGNDRALHPPPSFEDGPEELRAKLDRDQRRYSYLVFSITAALQALLFAKADLGGRFPWGLLVSSPPDPAQQQPNGYPMDCSAVLGCADSAIFRGVWIGDEVDEERAKFQYSFQSFSRKMAGVAQVLCFYASVDDSPTARLAADSRHILVLVARSEFWRSNCFALPVQLLDGPREHSSELEVLLPPYVQYEFEDDLSVSSADFGASGPLPEAAEKLECLDTRWKGFELPQLLVSMLQRKSVPRTFPEICALKPFVSVRFVRRIVLVKPLYDLFTNPECRLHDFKNEKKVR